MRGGGTWVHKAILLAAAFDVVLITYIACVNVSAAVPALAPVAAVASGDDLDLP